MVMINIDGDIVWIYSGTFQAISIKMYLLNKSLLIIILSFLFVLVGVGSIKITSDCQSSSSSCEERV
jgi:hypothetical protein